MTKQTTGHRPGAIFDLSTQERVLVAGDTWRSDIYELLDSDELPYAPDPTWSGTFAARPLNSSTNYTLSATTVTGTADSEWSVVIGPADTALFTSPRVILELELTDGTEVLTLFSGVVNVSKDVA